MRISFVLSSLRLSGGVLLVVEYANRLAERGHTVHLVVPGNAVDPSLATALHPDIRLLESDVPLPTRRTPLALARLIPALARITPRSHVLVATHTPTVLPVLLASCLDRKGHRAWLYMDYPEMFRTRPLERLLLRVAPRWFEGIMAISRPSSQRVMQQTRAPVAMVGSGLRNADLFLEQPRLPRVDGRRRVLYVGDHRPRKGLREFIVAAERVHLTVPELTLVIAAKLPCAVQTSVPCEFYLRPSDARLAELYAGSDLFVSASWGEGLGYPPLEAMACATPVVLTNSEGVLDYARDGENCLMVPPRDVQALAKAMLRVLEDEELARRLARNGPPTARQYDWEAATDRLEAAISGVVKK